MRIYNATNSVLSLPYGRERISISPKTPSGNILGNTEFLSLLVTAYSTKQIAFIVSGPFELNIIANIPTASQYTVQSLDEAIQRFAPKEEVKKEKKIVIKKESEVKKEEAQAPVVEEKPVVDEQPKEEEKQPEAVALEEQEVEVVEVKEKKPRKKKTTKAKKSE